VLVLDLTQDLRAQGAVSLSSPGSWRLGWLGLTGSTFTFGVPGRDAGIEIDLDTITGLDRDRRTFLLAKKNVLRLTCRPSASARQRTYWLITARLADWETALGQRSADRPPTAPAGLGRLSATSALILDYLACRGHATTAELMTLIGAETEEALLAEMRAGSRQLCPAACGPAVRYADRYFDAASQQVRQQTWRIGESVAAGWLASRIPADVFVEGDEVLVITSVPTQARGVPPSARTTADGRGLVLRHALGHDRWIDLPGQVTGEPRCAVDAAATLVIRGLRRAPAIRDVA
jgi:hypothetical protein